MTVDTLALDDAWLRAHPLPEPDAQGDKESRGRVLVVGGQAQMPGAVLLAGGAALRAGAGKLRIATARGIAVAVATALPESRVVALPETPQGEIAVDAAEAIAAWADRTDALLIGPGMVDKPGARHLVDRVLPAFGGAAVVLDAAAMRGVPPEGLGRPVLLTPHAGEMAKLMDMSKEAVQADPARIAVEAARRWNAVVALKGAVTHIATPSGACLRHEGGNAGLATSGSGDVLAGLITGLAARGAPLDVAAAWGVALHARAGEALSGRIGPLGYLAGELGAEVPRLMQRIQSGMSSDRPSMRAT